MGIALRVAVDSVFWEHDADASAGLDQEEWERLVGDQRAHSVTIEEAFIRVSTSKGHLLQTTARR